MKNKMNDMTYIDEEITDTQRLDFVIKHGMPKYHEYKYRYFGLADYGWFNDVRGAIDCAIEHEDELND